MYALYQIKPLSFPQFDQKTYTFINSMQIPRFFSYKERI
jgi:hypothetical protein